MVPYATIQTSLPVVVHAVVMNFVHVVPVLLHLNELHPDDYYYLLLLMLMLHPMMLMMDCSFDRKLTSLRKLSEHGIFDGIHLKTYHQLSGRMENWKYNYWSVYLIFFLNLDWSGNRGFNLSLYVLATDAEPCCLLTIQPTDDFSESKRFFVVESWSCDSKCSKHDTKYYEPYKFCLSMCGDCADTKRLWIC